MKTKILTKQNITIKFCKLWEWKLLLVLVLLCMECFSTNCYGQIQCLPIWCKVDTIDISTGYDHINGAFYADCAQDEYWRLVNGPVSQGPYPRCAISQGPTAMRFASSDACCIGADCNNIPVDGNFGLGSCMLPLATDAYVFERDFQICANGTSTSNAILDIHDFAGDNEVREIRLLGPNGYNNLLDNTCWEVNGIQGLPQSYGLFGIFDGVYTLRITVSNKWIQSSIWPFSWNLPSIMHLQMSASVYSITPRLIDNQHFGKNTTSTNPNFCAQPYIPFTPPTVTGIDCLPSPTSTSNFIINPYNTAPYNAAPYTINIIPAPISQTGALFVAGVGTYTIIVGDGLGCTISTVLEIGVSPLLSLSASPGCINPGLGNASVITASVVNPGNYHYKINGLPPQLSNQFTVNTSGTYAITVIGTGKCQFETKYIYVGDCSLCSTQNSLLSNAKWYKNPISSIDIGTATPTSPIVIDGVLTVDQNLNIWNNPNVYFTRYSSIKLSNPSPTILLDINNSTLKECNLFWGGVFADNSNETVKINNSRVQKMFETQNTPNAWFWHGGINISNRAHLEVTNSLFVDNFSSLNIYHSTAPYSTKIENNILKGVDWGIPYGICIKDVEEMKIGDIANANSGNHFEHLLRSGIDVRLGWGTAPPYLSKIEMYNNSFKDIRLYYNMIGNPLYENDAIYYSSNQNQPTSAAIDARAKGLLGGVSNEKLSIKVANTYAEPLPLIEDCEIGIYSDNTNTEANQLQILNTLIGIKCQSGQKRNYTITNCKMDGMHLGIKLTNGISTSLITNNDITTRWVPVQVTLPPLPKYKVPVGIDISQNYTNINQLGVQHDIENNTVNLNTIAGIGINLLNADKHTYVGNNYVNFNTIDLNSNIGSYLTHALYGYSLMNCSGATLDKNWTTGSSNSQVWNARNSIGIYLDGSPKCNLKCNLEKYTRYGFYVWGDATTKTSFISHNKFSGNRYPWYFLDAGSAVNSTFGTQGDASTDNGNVFLGSVNWLNSNGFKVYRYSTTPIQDQIWTSTNLLLQSESGALTFGSEYKVLNPPGQTNTDPCPAPVSFFTGGGGGTLDPNELSDLEDIVEDSVDYINYPQVGQWLDHSKAYAALEEDSTLRYSNLQLLNFYDATHNTLIGKIYDANEAISLLSDETTNPSNFTARYADAVNKNNMIVNGEDWEMNEKYVNDIAIKLIAGTGIDTILNDTTIVDSTLTVLMPYQGDVLTQSERDFLQSLSYSCPFVEGTAVYKARVIWSKYEPDAFYDDRVLCVANGNKNIDMNNIDIDSLYESQIQNGISQLQAPIKNIHKLKQGEVVIYPNPAFTNITIEYSCVGKGNFELVNGIGEVVLKKELAKGKQTTKIALGTISSGIYYYRCHFDGCDSFYGKLVISK